MCFILQRNLNYILSAVGELLSRRWAVESWGPWFTLMAVKSTKLSWGKTCRRIIS